MTSGRDIRSLPFFARMTARVLNFILAICAAASGALTGIGGGLVNAQKKRVSDQKRESSVLPDDTMIKYQGIMDTQKTAIKGEQDVDQKKDSVVYTERYYP